MTQLPDHSQAPQVWIFDPVQRKLGRLRVRSMSVRISATDFTSYEIEAFSAGDWIDMARDETPVQAITRAQQCMLIEDGDNDAQS